MKCRTHQDDPDKMAKIASIDKLFATQFAYFLQKLMGNS